MMRGIKKYGKIAILALLLITLVGCSSDDEYIDGIKNSYLDNYNYGKSIGVALNGWFDNGEVWSTYERSNIRYVECRGTTTHSADGKAESEVFLFQYDMTDEEKFSFISATTENGDKICSNDLYENSLINSILSGITFGIADGESVNDFLYEIAVKAAFGDDDSLETIKDVNKEAEKEEKTQETLRPSFRQSTKKATETPVVNQDVIQDEPEEDESDASTDGEEDEYGTTLADAQDKDNTTFSDQEDEEDTTFTGEEDKSEYIIPDSDTRVLKKGDVNKLSASQCRLARNEIYARHGRLFSDSMLQKYFDKKDWYTGYIEPNDFDESVLSVVEKKNIKLIKKYE